ncbi:MAG: hypothetical protein ACYDB0_00850 [Acidithiobacillus sp.]
MVDKLFYSGLNRADAKSLTLYQAIREKLESSPDQVLHIQNALTWVQKFKPSMPEVPYLDEWEQRLQAAIRSGDARQALLDWMTSTDEHAITMRSCSPFSQVLTTRERTDVLVRFTQEYQDNAPKAKEASHAG